MAIKTTVSRSSFMDALRTNFSYDGASALYDYYDELSDDLGEDIEFDPVAIRCEWSEYTLDEYNQEFGLELADLDELESLLERDDIKYMVVSSDRIVVSNY